MSQSPNRDWQDRYEVHPLLLTIIRVLYPRGVFILYNQNQTNAFPFQLGSPCYGPTSTAAVKELSRPRSWINAVSLLCLSLAFMRQGSSLLLSLYIVVQCGTTSRNNAPRTWSKNTHEIDQIETKYPQTSLPQMRYPKPVPVPLPEVSVIMSCPANSISKIKHRDEPQSHGKYAQVHPMLLGTGNHPLIGKKCTKIVRS